MSCEENTMSAEDYNSESKRHISAEFANAFFNGSLRGLLDQIKDKNNKLVLCYRGKYCNVYYDSHSIFKITEQTKAYLFEFNFNHARFTEDHAQIVKNLKVLNIEVIDSESKSKKTGKTTAARTAKFYVKKDGSDNKCWHEIIKIYKNLVHDFLNTGLTYDYFTESTKRKSPHTEKKDQQAIFTANFKNPDFFL